MNDEIKIDEFFLKNKNKNQIIFSIFGSLEIKNEENEEDKELNLFNKNYSFSNKVINHYKIKDFCIESELLFNHNSIEKYYTSIGKERLDISRYHIYSDFQKNVPNVNRITMKLIGPRKTSKSIYMRCASANYRVKYNRFRPSMIFDISFIYNNILENNKQLHIIIYHELFNLFQDIYDVDEFFKLIDFNMSETLEFIEYIIKLYFIYFDNNKVNITSERPLFCIDNYSHFYDKKII